MYDMGITDYDKDFVGQSVELAKQVEELRLVRDALSVTRSQLSMKKLELSMRQSDLRDINKEILKTMIAWRRTVDQLDELLEQQLGYINTRRFNY